ncbi:hypothetical protein DFH28DRAFT_932401 [Melampsora americana]|nr:hypothetical protein DFH28DRAFT_932401 [Melampsora americana]
MDGLVASDLTGQTPTTTPKTPTIPSKTRPSSSRTLDKVILHSQALLGPVSSAPASLEGPRKRHRQRAPSPSPLDEAEDITGTPQSVRIAQMFPGGSGTSSKPLGALVQKLLDISKSALVPKSKRAKTVNIDVELAADILVLASLIQDQANTMEARRVVFDPSRQTASSPSSFATNAQFEF